MRSTEGKEILKMNDLQIFSNEEFGTVRSVEIDGKPYFVANDVARALGYASPKDAVLRHCKGATIQRYLTNGGEQEVKMIPEGDIYRLIIRSSLPSAEKFETWVFDEVIPSIRKTGGYNLPKTYAEALRELADRTEKMEALQKQNQLMQPKAEFFDAVTDSKTAIPIGDVAKILDIGIGRNKLFEFLREKNILTSDNRPYQRYIDAGYFRVIEQKYEVNGEVRINIKTLVFQKGIDWIRKQLAKEAS